MSVLVYQSRFDVPRPPVTPSPSGWSVALPDLIQPPKLARAALVATGLSLVPGAINNAAAHQPLGFELAPQAPTTYAPRSSTPAAQTATGLSLSSQPVVQSLVNGWTVSPPDLPAFRRFQVPVHAGATSPIISVQPPSGWTVNVPELPQFKRTVFGATAGLSLPPQPIIRPLVNGWSIALPELPQPKLSNAAQVATGLTLPPQPIIRPLVNGWTVNVPELPQFSRKQAFPELTGRIDPPPIPPVFPYGWSVFSPDLLAFRRFQVPVHAVATSSTAATVQPLFGWTINTPELPQFRWKQALPEYTSRIDKPPIPPAFPYGWSVASPDLPAFRRFQVPVHAGATSTANTVIQSLINGWTTADTLLKRPTWTPEALGQIVGFGSFAPTFPWGWVAALPDLPQPKLSRAAQVATGLTLPPQPIIRPLVNGWSIALPDLPQPKLSKAAQVATGLTLPPQPIIRPLVNGWSIALPELPQPKLSNAAQVATGLTLPPQPIIRPLVNGWTVALPDLPAFRRFFPMPEWTGRIDPPPIPPAFPYGWTVNVPELPQFKRTISGSTAGLTLAPQPIIRPLVNGWSIALPDLPAFRRYFRMPEWAGRVDFLPGSGSAVVFACAATQAVVAYSAATGSDAADYEAFGGNVADYGASGGDVAYSAVGRLNVVAYYQTVLLTQAQLYGSINGKDVADYGAANTDVAYYKVTMLEFACTG